MKFLYIVELCSAGDFQKRIFYFSGPNSSPIAGTDTTLTMDENGRAPTHPENWHARLIGQNKTDVTVGVSPPCNCFVGEWSLFISAQSKMADNNVHKEEFECSSDINILLNPWCKGLELFYFDIHLKHAKLSVLRCYSTLWENVFELVKDYTWNLCFFIPRKKDDWLKHYLTACLIFWYLNNISNNMWKIEIQTSVMCFTIQMFFFF